MLILFYLFAVVSVICALGVLVMKNPIHCALMLGGTFFCLGAVYVMLNAEFVAVIQVLVYVVRPSIRDQHPELEVRC